jgi:hypothetical protein
MEMPSLPSGFHDPDEHWARFLAARRADLRIEVVKRTIDQGALAGMGVEISDYAAWLVIDALDSFDADAEQRAYAQGFRQGVAFERVRRGRPCS